MATIKKGDFMEFNSLVSLKKLTPLSNVVEQIDAAAFLGKSLYRIGGGIYLYLTKFGGGGANTEGPFLSGIFFAPDDCAMMRVAAMNIEEDSGSLLTSPAGFLPDEVLPEYGPILNWLKDMRPNVCQESASYRIASDGLFVHRTIETERYTFYFRGATDDDHEPPYAILYKY
ncbi:hypothetical protein [Massilia sp. TWP1-3-3]|uniref:hypothetical protein n=1 Tax=Massilia sp. TWP1-3-3 TaxID=2804573 RepID=UPI003CE742EF